MKVIATVAQSVEQLIRNQQVAGSSPASSSKNKQLVFANCLFFFFRFMDRNTYNANCLQSVM